MPVVAAAPPPPPPRPGRVARLVRRPRGAGCLGGTTTTRQAVVGSRAVAGRHRRAERGARGGGEWRGRWGGGEYQIAMYQIH